MDTETFSNPTDVSLQTPASLGNRVVAILIDSILTGLISVIPFIGWAIGLGYYLLRDSLPFLNGQSLGKKFMKIKTVDDNGNLLINNYVPSLIRNLTLMIPLFPLVELIILTQNPVEMRRLGDQWAKTRVVAE